MTPNVGEATTLGEVGYLDHIDAANAATTNADRVPFAGAIDPLSADKVDLSYTEGRA